MENKTIKSLFIAQTLILLGGTIFAWSKLIPRLIEFQEIYGTLFHFKDCAIPNALITACFYGSLAFLVPFIWSARLVWIPNEISARYLRYFLLFCVIFAGSVFLYEVVDYYKIFAGNSIPISCSPGVPPFQTPCFYGMLFFFAAFIFSIYIARRLSQGKKVGS